MPMHTHDEYQVAGEHEPFTQEKMDARTNYEGEDNECLSKPIRPKELIQIMNKYNCKQNIV